jgi:pyridoxine kinase
LTNQKILAISGSDILSGGGMQADLATYAHYNIKGFVALTSIVTAVGGRYTIHATEAHLFQEQLNSFDEMAFAAIKIGLLPNLEIATLAANWLETRTEPVILDPVLVFKEEADAEVTQVADFMIERLFPRAEIITPNLREAEKLSGMTIADVSALEEAARKLYQLGAKRVVIKGGARLHPTKAIDGYFDGEQFQTFEQPLLNQNNTGAGCTFASSIASLSLSQPMDQAVRISKGFVYQSILNGDETGVFQNK